VTPYILMPKLKCDFCGNEFTTKSNLNQHQKRTKYCLELQGISTKTVYECEKCAKTYSSKCNLKRHQKTCTFRKTNNGTPIYENEQFLQFMERVIEAVAKTPTTSNTTINLQPITYQYLETEGNKHLTEQIVMEGRQQEIAGKIFDGYIVVADKSRKKLKYKDEEGRVSTNTKKLVQEFYKAIQSKNQELADKLYGEIRESVNVLIAEGRVGDSDFTQLLTSGTNLQDRLIAIKNLTDGIVDDNSTKLLDETIKCIISEN